VRPMIAHVKKRVHTSVLFELYVAGQLVNELVSREVERLGLKGPAQLQPYRGGLLFADNTGGRLYTVPG
jgi:hypothetical protein